MGSFAKNMILCHANITMSRSDDHHRRLQQAVHAPEEMPGMTTRRWALLFAALAGSAMPGLWRPPPPAQAQSWGTHSFIKEKYFQPGLTPEEAAARIRQTAEGLREIRHMLDTMSWRFVLYYIRLKQAYLDADLKNAVATVPEARRKSYVKIANELVENMAELDRYVRSPKVYESYLYYEKTLNSLDELIAMLA
ncbi:photosynthetic NDH subunit of lumenal location 2, chloroplastic-like [Phoenix dactylifera]|uniref:Photosynthetic NDH subunit of lumenal location 2, chloroplastic-like n=1 Tax=Phoenix dactylifera TaxID=42345 RepID=A0A8B7BR37_PHODC|nr:photosynthetic NDH subunit of lumenal location 2, chloroplastic-like [Phoenix dactylifera]